MLVSADPAERFTIAYAGQSVTVESNAPALCEQIPRLYRHYCRSASPSQDPALKFRLAAGSPGRSARAAIDISDTRGAHEPKAVPEPLAFTILRERIQYHLVHDQCDHLMLHGAGVAQEGGAWLFPAPSGAGKTSLAAWLGGQGFRVLSDELVAINGARHASGFLQPLNVKAHGLDLIASFPWMQSMLGQALMISSGQLLPWDARPCPPLPVAGIIFPRYQPDARFQAMRLGPGAATAELLRCLLNARNLPCQGLQHAGALLRDIPAWRVCYSNLPQLTAWLQELSTASGQGPRCSARQPVPTESAQ